MGDFVSFLVIVGLLSLGLAGIFLWFFLFAFLIYYSDKDNNEK